MKAKTGLQSSYKISGINLVASLVYKTDKWRFGTLMSG